MRKKKSEMTPVELVDQALKGRTWEEAEEAGVEILARCMAFHAYAKKDGEEYYMNIVKRICLRADAWAKDNAFMLGCARAGLEQRRKEAAKEDVEPAVDAE